MIAKIVLTAIVLLALRIQACLGTARLAVVQRRRERRLGRTSRQPRPAPLQKNEKSIRRHRKGHRLPINEAFQGTESSGYAVPLLIELSHNEESAANADNICSAVITAYNTFQPSCNRLSLKAVESIVTVENDRRILTICVHWSCLMRNCTTGDRSVFDATVTRQLRRRRQDNVTSAPVPLYSESGSCVKPSQQQVVDRVNADLDLRLLESRGGIIEIRELNSSLCSKSQQAPSSALSFSEMKSTIPSTSPNLPGSIYQSSTEQAMVVETPKSRKSMIPSTPPSKRPLREGNENTAILPSHISISKHTPSIHPGGSPSYVPVGFLGLTSDMPTDEAIRSEGPSRYSTVPSQSPSASVSPSVSPSSIRGFQTMTPREWTRRGQTIDGDKSGDGFGRTLSISGDGLTIIAGARGHDGGGDFAGIVREYSFIDKEWVSKDISSGSVGDAFGTSVSLSGDGRIVLAGALGKVNSTENPLRHGYAKVFVKDNGTWLQMGQTLRGKQLGDGFGTSVSISLSGDIVAVAAHGGVVSTGYVQMFRFLKEEWVPLGSPIPASIPMNDMDRVMSLSGDGLTVAAVHENTVKIFAMDLSRKDGWKELSDPQISGKDLAISLSGDGRTLAVGSWQENLVRVMNYKDGVWKTTTSIASDNVGLSVSLSPSGKLLGVGSARGRFSRIQVFTLTNDRWAVLGNTAILEVPASLLGSAVGLSSENKVSIAAGNPMGSGHIECFYYTG